MKLAPFSLTVAATLAVFAACTGTPGRASEFVVAAEAIAPPGATTSSFTTESGWDVTLSSAHVALGPVYAYAPASAAWRALLPVAHAHVGEDPFGSRTVRGNALDQIDLDVLGPAVELGRAAGSFGEVSDVTVVLDPPAAAIAAALHGRSLWLEGTAARGAETVRFEGGLDLPEGVDRVIEGIPLDALLDDGDRLIVEVHPVAWLDEVQFDRLPAPVDGVSTIDPGTQPAIAWRLGVRSAAAWSARWEPASRGGS
jgi:hypothetical protein